MSNSGDALEAIGGLILAGIMLALLAPALNSVTTINLTLWAGLFMFVGVVSGVVIVVAFINSIL